VSMIRRQRTRSLAFLQAEWIPTFADCIHRHKSLSARWYVDALEVSFNLLINDSVYKKITHTGIYFKLQRTSLLLVVGSQSGETGSPSESGGNAGSSSVGTQLNSTHLYCDTFAA